MLLLWEPLPGPIHLRGFAMRQAILLIVLCAGSSGPAYPQGSEPRSPYFEIDKKAGQVIRRDADGKIIWSTKLKRPLDSEAETELACDSWRLYLSHQNQVTALDAATGKPLWYAAGPADHLLVSGRLLLAIGMEADAWWFVGRGTASGVRVFKIKLPEPRLGPWSVREVAGLFVVQTDRLFSVEALFITPQGKILHHFTHPVIAALRHDRAWAVLTRQGVASFSSGGERQWRAAFEDCEWMAEGGLMEAGGDELLAFQFSPISDSGVELVRLKGATGEVVWRARCAPLSVKHSKSNHNATVAIEGERVRVTSQGSHGTFVEVLNLKTGKQLTRTVSKN
jgi:hypothetical protein